MSKTHAERLRDRAYQYRPMDEFLASCANALDRMAKFEAAAFEAHDCLGGEDEIREILAKVCESRK